MSTHELETIGFWILVVLSSLLFVSIRLALKNTEPDTDMDRLQKEYEKVDTTDQRAK